MVKLTPTEEQAMQAIWKTGEAHVKLFLENITEPKPPYTTLASTVKNLEKKGFVTSRLVGNVYLYTPAIQEEEYKKKFLSGVVQNYFSNSYKNLVNFFVEQNNLSTEELKEIINLIEGKNKK
jgi:predicted transcriptional regulator